VPYVALTQHHTALLVYVAIASTLSGFSCWDCVETPSISSITPTDAVVGSPKLELIIKGTISSAIQLLTEMIWLARPRL